MVNIKRLLFLISILGIFSLGMASYAQTTPPPVGIIQEKIERERGDFMRERMIEEEPAPVVIEDERPEIIVTEEEISGKVYVERFVLRGVTEFEPETFVPFLSDYRNSELGIKEFNDIANAIQNFYRKNGYITTIVYIPVQRIADNTVEIRVIEGQVGQIKVEGAKYSDEEYLRERFQIREGDRIAYRDLVKRIRGLNAQPDRTVKAIMLPGDLLETTDLVLKVDERSPHHVFIEYNNFGTRYSGKNRFTLGYTNNNLSGFDDIFSLRFERSDMELMGGSVDYNFPFTPNGTRFGGYVSYVDVNIGKEFKPLNAEGRSLHGGIYVNHPFTSNKENFQGNFNVGFDIKREKNYILNNVSSSDKLSVAKVGLSLDWYDSMGRTFISQEIHGGIPYLAGALGRKDPAASRIDAGGDFIKGNVTLARRQNLPWSSFLLLTAKGQYTSDKLVSGEQFYIGGADTVRGYPELEYMGDYGYVANFELRTPAFIFPESFKITNERKPLRDALQFVYFCDYGQAWLREPLVGERETKSLWGAGVGLRLNLWDNFYIRADWARPIQPEPSDGADNKIHLWAHLDLI